MWNNIKEILKWNRPNLTNQSINTYYSIITNLSKKINETINDVNDISKHLDKIITYLKDMNWKKRKTIYAALLVLSDNNNKDNDTIINKLRI